MGNVYAGKTSLIIGVDHGLGHHHARYGQGCKRFLGTIRISQCNPLYRKFEILPVCGSAVISDGVRCIGNDFAVRFGRELTGNTAVVQQRQFQIFSSQIIRQHSCGNRSAVSDRL